MFLCLRLTYCKRWYSRRLSVIAWPCWLKMINHSPFPPPSLFLSHTRTHSHTHTRTHSRTHTDTPTHARTHTEGQREEKDSHANVQIILLLLSFCISPSLCFNIYLDYFIHPQRALSLSLSLSLFFFVHTFPLSISYWSSFLSSSSSSCSSFFSLVFFFLLLLFLLVSPFSLSLTVYSSLIFFLPLPFNLTRK